MDSSKYRFIGMDGSMGLDRGAVYLVSTKTMKFGPHKILAIVHLPNKVMDIPYESIRAFMKNWELDKR